MEHFPTGITEAGVQKSGPDEGAAAVHNVASEKLSQNQQKSSTESSSVGPKVLDKILSYMEDDIIRELEDFWVRKASKIVNVPTFCLSLARQNLLTTTDIQRLTRQQDQEELWTKRAIKAACSKKAMGSLVFAFQSSGNEWILEQTLGWLETAIASGKNCPIKVRRLAINLIKGGSERLNLAFLEQLPPLHDLEEFAKFDNQPESSTSRTFSLEFDKEKVSACATGWGVTLWNWRRANGAKQLELGVRVDDVTCMQSDEEILVLGTAQGFVHLFNSKKIKEKCVIVLGDYEPVQYLKFVGSTLLVLTRAGQTKIWWVDISRPDIQLLNKRLITIKGKTSNAGFFVHPEYTFWYFRHLVHVYSTKSGKEISGDSRRSYLLEAPADLSTLGVVDLVSTKGNIVGGCENGVLAMWNPNQFLKQHIPLRVIYGHKVAVVSLCGINGHLLSLDESGKLFMWSGYDLEDKFATPAPLKVAENAVNVTILVANGRWFASSSSKDETGSSGTLAGLSS